VDTKCYEEKRKQKALFRCRWRKSKKEQKSSERNTHSNKRGGGGETKMGTRERENISLGTKENCNVE
jgi:hypothetical protein